MMTSRRATLERLNLAIRGVRTWGVEGEDGRGRGVEGEGRVWKERGGCRRRGEGVERVYCTVITMGR